MLLPTGSKGKRPHYLDKKSGKIWFSDSKSDQSEYSIHEYDLNTQTTKELGTIRNPNFWLSQVSQFQFKQNHQQFINGYTWKWNL